MGVPSISTNLSGFGCFMEEMLENSSDYGIYIVDRRMKSVEESINQLTDYMFHFCQKTRRQRINQRNRTERLSDILDWKLMGMEYVRARKMALQRAYSDSFIDTELADFQQYKVKIPKPLSAPGSPGIRGIGPVNVDDFADEISNISFRTSESIEEKEDEQYPFPIVIRRRHSIDDSSILDFKKKIIF
jgi:glycogen(starch) synthase